MDEPIEDLRPISAIYPTRRILPGEPRLNSGRNKYQFKRSSSSSAKFSSRLSREPSPPQQPHETSHPEGLDLKRDLQDRIAFDRITKLGI